MKRVCDETDRPPYAQDDAISEFDNGGGEAQFKNFKQPAWDGSTVTPWRADGRSGRVRGIN